MQAGRAILRQSSEEHRHVGRNDATAVLEQHDAPFSCRIGPASRPRGAPSRRFVIERFGANLIDRLGPVAEYRRTSC
jgi:hypothetical protein